MFSRFENVRTFDSFDQAIVDVKLSNSEVATRIRDNCRFPPGLGKVVCARVDRTLGQDAGHVSVGTGLHIGQIVIKVPSAITKPPIHIQTTNGRTSTFKVA